MVKPYWQDNSGSLYQGDVLAVLKELPADSVDCCITSPPYWGLRCYLPDEVKIKENLADEEKKVIEKELAILGINGIIR